MKLVEGLDEFFKVVPRDYNFHDMEFESIRWKNGEEIVIKLNIQLLEKIYYITWFIKPDGDYFEFYGAPHNPYISGLDIKAVPYHPELVRFECDESGLMVNARHIWVEIHEIPEEDYKLFS